jgi:hypothetical protein
VAIVWLIVATAVTLGLGLGASRAAARAYLSLAVEIAGVLVAAGICYLIADTKTSGYLAGIVGAGCSLLLLFIAGGLTVGGGLCWLLGRMAALPGWRRPLWNWDLWLIGALALAGILMSAAE